MMTESPNQPALKSDKHMPALDGLRGWAVLAVMFYHFAMPFAQESHGRAHWATLRIMLSGSYGVDMFFVLSGFLITGILLDSKSSRNYFKTFYARRILRIFPLYYGVLAVCFGLLWWMPILKQFIPHQWWLWLYIANFSDLFGVSFEPMFSHFWSLAIEEQFYIVWPLVVLLVSRRNLMLLCASLALGSTLIRCGLIAGGVTDAITAACLTPCRLDGLAMGALLAAIARGPVGLSGFRYWGVALTTVGAISTLVLKGLYGSADDSIWGLSGAGHYTMCATVAGLLILAVAGNGFWKWFLNNNLLRCFGKYSYGLYVFHYLLAPWLDTQFWFIESNAAASLVLHVLAACAVTFLVAYVSWHLYEKQILKFKDRFSYEYGPAVRHTSLRAGDMTNWPSETPHYRKSA